MEQPWSSKLATSLSIKLASDLFLSNLFFCSSFQISTFYSFRKNVEKVLVIQTSFVPHNSAQNTCTPKCSLCWFVLFWRRKKISLNFAIQKISQVPKNVFICQLKIQYISGHTASKVDRVENEGDKCFT